MTGALLIALSMAQSAGTAAPAASEPVRPIQIFGMSQTPSGDKRVGGVFKVMDPTARGTGPMFFYAMPTTCEGAGSSTRPDENTYGWEVEVTPGMHGRPAIRWKRLPGAAAVMGEASGTVPMDPRARTYAETTLDAIDGSARLAHRRRIETLKAIDLASLELEPIAELREGNVRLFNFRLSVSEAEQELKKLTTTRGAKHPDVITATERLRTRRQQFLDEKARVVRDLIRQYQEGLIPLQPVNGCNAVSYSLIAQYAEPPAGQLLEAELWFIHRAPDGKETTQRQAVRMKEGGRGDFYFDDLDLTVGNAEMRLPIAVEVFGAISAGSLSDGQAHVSLKLTRRYVNRSTALGKWPKTGSTDYPLTITPGEVVSFVLPPLDDDGGILLGHRFSLRLRLKPLGPDGN